MTAQGLGGQDQPEEGWPYGRKGPMRRKWIYGIWLKGGTSRKCGALSWVQDPLFGDQVQAVWWPCSFLTLDPVTSPGPLVSCPKAPCMRLPQGDWLAQPWLLCSGMQSSLQALMSCPNGPQCSLREEPVTDTSGIAPFGDSPPEPTPQLSDLDS